MTPLNTMVKKLWALCSLLNVRKSQGVKRNAEGHAFNHAAKPRPIP
ncbi:MAG: hypothetical protein Q7U38_18300 [Methylobacter sp.]|nr:hypothetical protein [Methylobacter sp.]MDP2099619.1 hypothetical protein [Methylobacter sp.]MDP2429815.1 hypothetical protein [Methylobacter sp.]MDP3055535.1 hypothetical protein [Methylobacter sp.]MDP3361341.1 hypothetical protein [Methylobacter sp.]